MSDIKPFRGVRPRPDLVQEVASPPYDVLNSREAREMAGGNPRSFLHVVKAEIDLPPDVDVHSEAVYELSAAHFRAMRQQGVLIQDETPCFYVYRLRMGEHVQTGLAVGVAVDEYESGAIKKHEHTMRVKEDDRARHMEVLMANAGPVLFTFRTSGAIRSLMGRVVDEHEPVYDFVADDGIGHQLWVVSDPGHITALQEAFKPLDALYVADGHHRSASAFRVRAVLRDKNPAHTGTEPYNYFLAVLFPDDELKIMGYHRVVKDLNGYSVEEFLARVGESFRVTEAEERAPGGAHRFMMYLDGRWYELTALPGTFAEDDPVKSLDASILQENLLAPVLGIEDVRTDTRIDFVGGMRGTAELVRRCRDDMRVAFALAPVTVGQLMAIADAGAIMPPKSTWFEPKLRSGVVVRTLED